jgi:NADH-quinone oxidoreductase subunit M
MFMLEQPLALILLILLVGFVLSLSVSAASHDALRVIALVTSLCALLAGVLSCLAFNKSDFGFQFITKLHFIPEYNLALTLGADGLSMIFLLLTLFIFPILFLSA